jgi:hypothetical protein
MRLTSRWPEGEAERRVGKLRAWWNAEREAMGQLLATIPWQVYCTWHFRDRIGKEGVLRQVRRWLGCLAFAFRDPIGWMIGLERDSGAQWPHAHGLVVGEGLGEPVRLYTGKPHEKTVPFLEPFWLAWQQRHGGGYFVPIDGRGTRPVSFYCAKYAERGEIYFSTGLERFRGAPPAEAVTLYLEQLRVEAGARSAAAGGVLRQRGRKRTRAGEPRATDIEERRRRCVTKDA